MAGIVTRSESVFMDVSGTLQRMGIRRIVHMSPESLLAAPKQTFWVVDGRWPGAGALIQRLLSTGRESGMALAGLNDTPFITACHQAGVPALLTHRTVDPPESKRGGPFSLTARDIEILRHCSEGKSNDAIGKAMGISGLTVKSHMSKIGRKMGAGDRAHMVMLALRAGLI